MLTVGALILFKQGKVRLEQLHCQDNVACQDIRRALEQVTRNMTANSSEESKETSLVFPGSIDEQVRQYLGNEVLLL